MGGSFLFDVLSFATIPTWADPICLPIYLKNTYNPGFLKWGNFKVKNVLQQNQVSLDARLVSSYSLLSECYTLHKRVFEFMNGKVF